MFTFSYAYPVAVSDEFQTAAAAAAATMDARLLRLRRAIVSRSCHTPGLNSRKETDERRPGQPWPCKITLHVCALRWRAADLVDFPGPFGRSVPGGSCSKIAWKPVWNWKTRSFAGKVCD